MKQSGLQESSFISFKLTGGITVITAFLHGWHASEFAQRVSRPASFLPRTEIAPSLNTEAVPHMLLEKNAHTFKKFSLLDDKK